MSTLTDQRALIAELMVQRDNAPLDQYAAHNDAVFDAREKFMDMAEAEDKRGILPNVPRSRWARFFGRVPVYAVGDA